MPVYIVGGRYDGIAPPANLEALHAQIPNSQLEFFEGGHAFMLQDRAALPSMVEFIAERVVRGSTAPTRRTSSPLRRLRITETYRSPPHPRSRSRD